MNFEAGFSKCYSIGMTPVELTSTHAGCLETTALGFFNKLLSNPLCDTPNISSDGKWPPGTLFWTAGKKLPTKSNSYGWCLGQNATLIANDSRLWGANQPDAAESGRNCLQFKMNRTIGKISFHNRNCSLKFAYACQVRFVH